MSYLDDNVVGSAIKDACNDKRYLSKAIENAYLVESLKAKLDGNKFFDEVAHSVYDKFEGKITPAEFVGSSVYVGCFSGEHLSATLYDKISERDFVSALYSYLDGAIADYYKSRDSIGIIAQCYAIEDFRRDFFDPCTDVELSENLYQRLSGFFRSKEPYLELASIEGLFPEGAFDKLRDMNDDPYDYYDYQMSGALDDKYTGALSDDKAKSFNLEYYLDGLRSIAGDGNFSMQDLSCVYSRLSEAFHPIRDEILKHKDDKDLDSLYFLLSDSMDETFVSVVDKVNKIKLHMLADWFEEELGTLRQEVDMIGLDMTGSHKDGYVTKRDDDALLLGMLCERYYDEHFAKMGFSSELKHYRPHIMDAFLDAPDVGYADKFTDYKKYRDAISVDEVYNLDAKVGYKSWDNSFRLFRDSNASFGDYCSDYSVGETSLKNRRYLEDAAYAQGRGLTASLQKNIFAGLNSENAGLDKVEACIAKTVDIGEDFLANMNAVSGIVGYGIKKAFIAAGDDRGYGYLLSGAIASAHQGYGLDKLINDDYWGVRAEIANQGYGLDKLIHDEEPKVRLLAYDALRAEEEQQKSNQQGKRRVLFVQDNYDDEIENSEFDFDV